jgi:hypothetical protein
MNEWQAREHVLERVGTPGFLRQRRYASPDARPRNFTLIETEDLDVLASPAYLERLNTPTEWSRRSSPGLSNMRRSACRITATVGEVDGGSVATVEIVPQDAAPLRTWIAESALDELVSRPGVYAAHLLESDPSVSRIETTEKRLRAPDDIIDWAIVVEGLDPASITAAIDVLIGAESLTRHGAQRVAQAQTYRLSFEAIRTNRTPWSSPTGGDTEARGVFQP